MSIEEEQENNTVSAETSKPVKKSSDEEFRTIIKGSIIMAVAIVALMLILDFYDVFIAPSTVIQLPLNFLIQVNQGNFVNQILKLGLI